MKKKKLVILLLLTLSFTLIPFAVAKPGEEKNNEKFQYFKLYLQGRNAGDGDRWYCPPKYTGPPPPPSPAGYLYPPDGPMIFQVRGSNWNEEVVEVTVGTETLYPVDYFASVSWTIHRVLGRIIVLVKETVVFEDGSTLVIVAHGNNPLPFGTWDKEFTPTFTGHGTGYLQGVSISGICLGGGGTLIREGTVKDWPTP
jgi:hypothetical protein